MEASPRATSLGAAISPEMMPPEKRPKRAGAEPGKKSTRSRSAGGTTAGPGVEERRQRDAVEEVTGVRRGGATHAEVRKPARHRKNSGQGRDRLKGIAEGPGNVAQRLGGGLDRADVGRLL